MAICTICNNPFMDERYEAGYDYCMNDSCINYALEKKDAQLTNAKEDPKDKYEVIIKDLLTDNQIYQTRIQKLEDSLRAAINSNRNAHDSEIKVAKSKLALMYAKLIDEIEKSKHSVAAIESLLFYSKTLLKEEINFFKEEDGYWYTISEDGQKIRIRP